MIRSSLLFFVFSAPSLFAMHNKDPFISIKESIDKNLESVTNALSLDSFSPAPEKLKEKVNNLFKQKQNSHYSLAEDVLYQMLQSLAIALTDTCIPAGSGNTRLTQRLQSMQKSLVIFDASICAFIKKLNELKLTEEQKCALRIDHLHSLCRQATMQGDLIRDILKKQELKSSSQKAG